MEKNEYVSQREFARRVDRSPSYINRLVHNGMIPLDRERMKIPWEEGHAAFLAAAQPGYDRIREIHAEERARRENKPRKGGKEHMPRNHKSIGVDMGDGKLRTEAEVNFEYSRARAIEKTANAQIKLLELKVRKEELIEKRDVIMDAADTAAELRSLLLTIPSSVAPTCEGKSARQIEAIIEGAIVRAMQSLQNSIYAGDGRG